METAVINNHNLQGVLAARQPEICPYQDVSSNICAASLSSISIDNARHSCYCATDNYDNCALFLAKSLRRK